MAIPFWIYIVSLLCVFYIFDVVGNTEDRRNVDREE
jgi:hypothetical protein